MKRKLVVVGADGMLGQMAAQYFSRIGRNVVEIRDRFSPDDRRLIDQINNTGRSVVINCIGKIKQKTCDASELLLANAVWPLYLSERLDPDITLVHPSTDCVFSGAGRTAYSIDALHDAADMYGISKSLGEHAASLRPNSIILRGSIIGPDQRSRTGLFSWLVNQTPGAQVNGYTNHLWNGVTTLEWCRLVGRLLDDQVRGSDRALLYQIGSPDAVSKCQLLEEVRKAFSLDLRIVPCEAKETVNRVLIPTLVSGPIADQLRQLAAFV